MVSKPEVRQPPGAGDDVSARGASPTTRRFQAEQLVSVEGSFAATSVKEGLARRSQTQREQSRRGQDPESVRRQGLRVHEPGAFFCLDPSAPDNQKRGPVFPPDPLEASDCRLRIQARTGILLSMRIRVGQTKT